MSSTSANCSSMSIFIYTLCCLVILNIFNEGLTKEDSLQCSVLLNEVHLLHVWLQKHCPESELNSTHKSWDRLTPGVWQLFISVSCRGRPSITHVQHVRQGAASVESLCRRTEVKRFRVQEVRRERFFISRCGIVRTVKRSVVPSAVTDAYIPCFLEASQSGEEQKNLLISIQLHVITSAHFTPCLRSLRKTFLSHLDLRQVRVLKKREEPLMYLINHAHRRAIFQTVQVNNHPNQLKQFNW